MQIKFHGHTSFTVEEGDTTLLFDPYNDSIGLKPVDPKANILSVSWKNAPYNAVTTKPEGSDLLDWPGEYEVNGVHFKRLASVMKAEDAEAVENTITIVHWGKVRLCHLGVQAEKLTEQQLEHIGDVDILFVPVGGAPLLDAKKAKEVVEQIEPRVLIPMAYQMEGSIPVAEFLSEMGASGVEGLDVFKVKRSELPEDNSKVVLLSA
jgi:L-ascorbate metabolism protein UlaG (beta-lactamase superfamily)